MSNHGGEMEYGDGLFKSRRVPSVNTIVHEATERGPIKSNGDGFFWCSLVILMSAQLRGRLRMDYHFSPDMADCICKQSDL